MDRVFREHALLFLIQVLNLLVLDPFPMSAAGAGCQEAWEKWCHTGYLRGERRDLLHAFRAPDELSGPLIGTGLLALAIGRGPLQQYVSSHKRP